MPNDKYVLTTCWRTKSWRRHKFSTQLGSRLQPHFSRGRWLSFSYPRHT